MWAYSLWGTTWWLQRPIAISNFKHLCHKSRVKANLQESVKTNPETMCKVFVVAADKRRIQALRGDALIVHPEGTPRYRCAYPPMEGNVNV